jgi:signal transduction histidine kinase
MTSPVATRPHLAPRAADVALAVGVAVIALIGYGVSVVDAFPFLLVDHDGQPGVPISYALLEVAAEALPLIFRRAAPVLVFVLVAGASLADEALNRHPEPLPLAVLVALYTLAVMRRPLVAGIAAACYLVGLTADTATAWTDVSDDQLYIHLLAVVGTVLLGCWIYLGRARVSSAERRTLEVTRAFEARTAEAVDEERARIAREMHDVLGHQLSVIVAQAATTRRVSADRPQATLDALGSIESVGRDALSGLRRLVGLLRVDRGKPDRAAPAGLDRLGALVEQVRIAGLPADLVVLGTPRRLPAELELTAFRIVQEALTNSLRHSARTRVTVTLTYGADALDIDVADSGGNGHPGRVTDAVEGPPVDGSSVDGPSVDGSSVDGSSVDGYGLVGMRQRVEMLGGLLTVGPDAGRGFRVRAWLPVAEQAGRAAR